MCKSPSMTNGTLTPPIILVHSGNIVPLLAFYSSENTNVMNFSRPAIVGINKEAPKPNIE